MKNNKYIFIAVIFFIFFIGIGSIYAGFISPDSWNYLFLASSLINGDGCSIDGEYFAIYPCGYPVMIAGLSWLTGVDVFIASKIVNLLAISISGFLLYSATRSILVGFLFIINPITLYITQYTWSENAFILSFSLVFFALSRIYDNEGGSKAFLVLSIGLLMGVTTRYFFAPYAFLMFLVAWFIYGKKTALKSLPYFILAGACFLVYYYYNKAMTGYGGGMPRVSSPETVFLLVAYFFRYIVKESIIYFAALSPLLIFIVVNFSNLSKKFNFEKIKPYFALLSLGVVYLFMAFILRVHTQYDLYGVRTVGYGLVFIFTPLVSMFFINERLKIKYVLVLVAVGGFSLLITQRHIYINYSKIYQAMEKIEPINMPDNAYSNIIKEKITIIPFGVPPLSWGVSANPKVIYGDNYAFLFPKTMPLWQKEDVSGFISRLSELEGKCYFDFTRIEGSVAFQEILSTKYLVDIRFNYGTFTSQKMYENVYDDSVADFLKKVFVPGKLVSCSKYTNFN